MTSSFWKQVGTLADEAPEAGYPNLNFGKLVVTPLVVTWSDKDGLRTPEKVPLKEGQTLDKGQSLEIRFKVMISELNPKLEFDYDRTIPVRKSGRQKTDWFEVVLPSLEAVFGAKWFEKIGDEPYVCVEDFPNIAGRSSTSGKVYGVPKFLQVFKSKKECVAARDERFKKHDQPAEEGTIPDSVIEQTRSLIKSVGSAKAAEKILSDTHPFGDYDAATLIELAEVKE